MDFLMDEETSGSEEDSVSTMRDACRCKIWVVHACFRCICMSRVDVRGGCESFAYTPPPPQPPPPRAHRGGGLPLHQFLRLIAGGRMMDHGSASSNEDLVAALRRGGVIERYRSS